MPLTLFLDVFTTHNKACKVERESICAMQLWFHITIISFSYVWLTYWSDLVLVVYCTKLILNSLRDICFSEWHSSMHNPLFYYPFSFINQHECLFFLCFICFAISWKLSRDLCYWPDHKVSPVQKWTVRCLTHPEIQLTADMNQLLSTHQSILFYHLSMLCLVRMALRIVRCSPWIALGAAFRLVPVVSVKCFMLSKKGRGWGGGKC